MSESLDDLRFPKAGDRPNPDERPTITDYHRLERELEEARADLELNYKEADRLALLLIEQNKAHLAAEAAAEEARQEAHAARESYVWARARMVELEADLAEARQERDRERWRVSDRELRNAHLLARIQTLEAALREHHRSEAKFEVCVPCSRALQPPTEVRNDDTDELREAGFTVLQPTTDQEER